MTDFNFYPQKVVWEITFACNMRCLHCGTAAGKKRDDELSTAEALGLIDELADLGCEEITLSGGEPLMRKDWPLLAEHIKRRGLTALLITNGYAVTEDTLKEFRRVKLDNVGVSFDGTQKTHNHIRQRDNSYQRAIDAMRMMREAELPFCAVSQVSNMNLADLDNIYQDLIDVGCWGWRIQMTTTTGRMPRELVLTPDRFPEMVDKILELKKDGRILVDVGENIGFYGCKGAALYDDQPYLGCYAGLRVAGITSNGDVRGCLSMPEEFNEGNVRDGGFAAIWNKPDGFAYNRQFTRETASGDCYDCKYLHLCRGGCSTTSFSASGTRANNPYCMYQIERAQGIEPNDSEIIAEMLKRFPVGKEAEQAAE